MVPSSNAEAGIKIVENSKRGSLGAERGEIGTDTAHERDGDDEVGVKPIDMLVPVAPCDGVFGNVRLLQIILGGPQRLVVFRTVEDSSIGSNNASLGCAGRRHGGRRCGCR